MSKIEEIIIEIESYIENCKPAPFSGNRKILVDKDEIQDLIVQLKMRTPEEIKKYQKIVSNKEAILSNAKSQAEGIISDAKKLRQEMLTESDIVRDACAESNAILDDANRKAAEILGSANADAEAIRAGAIEYTDELLAGVQTVIVNSLEAYRNNYTDMVSSLQADYEKIMENRNELFPDDASDAEASEE